MKSALYRPRHGLRRPGAVTLAQLGIVPANRRPARPPVWHRWRTDRFADQVRGTVAMLVLSLATFTVSMTVAMIANGAGH